MENGKCLPIVANRFNRTTTHRFFTQHSFFLGLGLLVDKRVVLFVAPHEVVRRGVATNVAIDAGRVYIESTADVFLHFVVSIGHFFFILCLFSLLCLLWFRDESSLRD
jgi:hypothetical protein